MDTPPENIPVKPRVTRGKIKSIIIYGELLLIILLIASIVGVSIYQNHMFQQTIVNLTNRQGELTDELARLTGIMEQMEETLITQNSTETILTYDDTGTEVHLPILPGVPRHSYDWSCLQTKDGFKNYIENDEVISYRGIDVSSFQGEIDWPAVKAAGVDFAIIRVGYRGYGSGAILLDEYFDANAQGAIAAGIKVGVYFFSQAITNEEAVEEANFVLEHIKDYDITYPVVYDLEAIPHDTARTDYLTGRQATDHCIAFCDTVENAGYHSMVYSNRRWLLLKLDLTRLASYDIWYASYVSQPDFPYDFKIWQFTDSGNIPGITGDVDINIGFTDYSALQE